jgi:broad specificity phosphatase PhoE
MSDTWKNLRPSGRGVVQTSPLRRCVQTGAAIASACNLSASVLESLNDLDFGDWTWKTHDEVRATDPVAYRTWTDRPQLFRFPNGEAIQDAIARCADAIRLALERHCGQTVIMVTHDSVIRCMLLQLLDMPISAYARIAQYPCAVNEVAIAPESVRVLRVNDTGNPA